MKSKAAHLICIFLFLISRAAGQQLKDNSFFGFENYQSVFFTPFVYSDFSFRFTPSELVLNKSFGKSITHSAFQFINRIDSHNIDTLKAKSNVYLLLGTQKNQFLQVENFQKVSKYSKAYINYSSLASFGLQKNALSKNRSFNLIYDYDKNKYRLNWELLVMSNNDGCSGGVVDSILPRFYSKRDLQQLNVNLSNDFLKKKFFNIKINQNFSLFKSLDSTKSVDLFLSNEYSSFKYNYTGAGVSDYYSNVFYDSISTNDSVGYNWLTTNLGSCIKLKKIKTSLSLSQDNFMFHLQDSSYSFVDYSVDLRLCYESNKMDLKGGITKNISNNFRKYNQSIFANINYYFDKHFLSSFEYSIDVSSMNVPFIYQKNFSNHFTWNYDFKDPISKLAQQFNFSINKKINLEVKFTTFKNRVYLNEYIRPVVSSMSENLSSYKIVFNDTIGRFHLSDYAVFNYSNSKALPIPAIQNYFRLGYIFNMFKKNLKAESGVSVIYNDSWYATDYCPALDDFYIQSVKKYDGIPVLNIFANFKIKAATLFLKMERVNIGWISENNFQRNGYPAPPRTIRFGFNWPLVN